MSKVKFEIDTDEILEQIDAGDIVDALAGDIQNGDSEWWAEQVSIPVCNEIIKALNDKKSEFRKDLIECLAYRISADFDFKPIWNKLIEEKIQRMLKL